MIFFSLNLLKLFQYYPEIQSICILSPSYLHLISIHRSFIVRSSFVHSSFIVRLLFVYCSFIVRSLFVHCSSFVRLLFVHCSSFVRSLFVFCSFILHLPVWLTPSFLHICVTTVPPLEGDRGRFYSFLSRLLFVFSSSFVRLSSQ